MTSPRFFLFIEVDARDVPDGADRLIELVCQARARELVQLERKLRHILGREYGVSLSFRRTESA